MCCMSGCFVGDGCGVGCIGIEMGLVIFVGGGFRGVGDDGIFLGECCFFMEMFDGVCLNFIGFGDCLGVGGCVGVNDCLDVSDCNDMSDCNEEDDLVGINGGRGVDGCKDEDDFVDVNVGMGVDCCVGVKGWIKIFFLLIFGMLLIV